MTSCSNEEFYVQSKTRWNLGLFFSQQDKLKIRFKLIITVPIMLASKFY